MRSMTNKKKELVKNTIIIAIGKISTQFISFLLLPLYTALLTTEEFGIFDLITSYVVLLVPCTNFQMENSLFRFLVEVRDDEEETRILITNGLLFSIMQILIFGMCFLLIKQYIHLPFKEFIFFNTASSIIFNSMLQISRGLGDNYTYSISSFFASSGIIFFNIIFIVLFSMGAGGLLLANTLGTTLGTLYILYKKRIYRHISLKNISFHRLRKLLKYSIPLVPNEISWWLIKVSDRTIVSYILGVSANGVIAISGKFSSMYVQLYNIVNLSWTESIALHINDSDIGEYFSATVSQIYKIFWTLCMEVLILMPIIFPIFINSSFSNAFKYVPIYMYAGLCNVLVGSISVIYIANKRTKEIAKTSLVAGIINIIVHLILIRYIGLYAAPVSSLCGYLLMFIYRFWDLKKDICINLDIKLLIATLALSTIGLYFYYCGNLSIQLFWLMASNLLLIVMNRDFLLNIWKLFLELCKKISQMGRQYH